MSDAKRRVSIHHEDHEGHEGFGYSYTIFVRFVSSWSVESSEYRE
jgi:hypothetical protein